MFSSCLGSGWHQAAPACIRGFYPDNTRHRLFYCSLFCRSACCSADDWSWVTARRQKKKRKVLAGFARAIGDGALVATVHDIVVLPELHGLGLGRKLLAKITSQVHMLPQHVSCACVASLLCASCRPTHICVQTATNNPLSPLCGHSVGCYCAVRAARPGTSTDCWPKSPRMYVHACHPGKETEHFYSFQHHKDRAHETSTSFMACTKVL